ncbi:MarR family winged helix-turn-helix transcriptional regulator [Nonomuraea spiralis]|uniref:MarR family winged helix-turn-helix transcriptional regulator n=1 Tax=Nonomuraea spiralis TaxID=46182 RepID=A0ABV5IU48_9ACTN|nr:MarR family winged helix-turn-helix transcriptional regulator [Nonomuraea spiralis]GGS91501.1 MarR family transcriptional regulator [Nonomuraea spiralis]
MTVEGSLTNTVGFLLGKLGQQANGQFADRLAPLGLRPRHCAVLELLAGGPRAQLELAKAVGVTPSVVVDMLDELETLDAVRRVRDTADRRRQLIELTSTGLDLRHQTLSLARQNDEELLSAIDPTEVAALRQILGRIAAATGLVEK